MLSSDKNIETIEQLVKLLKHYIGLRSEYLKFDVSERIIRVLTGLAVLLVAFILIAIMLIYLSFAIAFALAPYTGAGTAFCLVTGFYLLILLLFLSFRHQLVEKPLVRFLVSVLLKK